MRSSSPGSLFTFHLSPFALLLLTTCDATLPPLRGQMEIGQDAYAVFAGGPVLNGDLYAVRPEGGTAVPITFTTVAEQKPALSPDGGALAFLRGASINDARPATVWVMNLLSGAERELALPKGAGVPERVGWASGGQVLIVAARSGLYRVNAPPAAPDPRPVAAAEQAQAESSLAVLLGDPVFARVIPCKTPGDLCVSGDAGVPSLLAKDARDPVRWGPDSVGFFVRNNFEIRPLGPGRPRRLVWSNVPEHPREMSFFPGKVRSER